MPKHIVFKSALIAFVSFASVASHARADDAKTIAVPAGDLITALKSLVQQSGIDVIYRSDQLEGLQTRGVSGALSPQEAVTKLLEGTPLTVKTDSSGAILIARPPARGAQPAGAGTQSNTPSTTTTQATPPIAKEAEKKSFWSRFRLAQVDQGSPVNDTTTGSARRGDTPVELQEVVVTAQKRLERLIDTPQAISVITSESLARLGATQFRDFASTVPGLSFTTEGSGRTQISLRGVTIGSDLGATVAVYVDDVPYTSSAPFSSSGAFALDVGLSGLERIEVLRGPQGTLYGASTMGGLIKYVTKQPDSERFSGSVQSGIAGTQDGAIGFNVTGEVNAPLVSEKLALRVSGFEFRDGGFIDNVASGRDDVNRSDIYGGRVDLLFTPTDSLSIRVNGFTQDIQRDGRANTDYSIAGQPLFGDLAQSRNLPEAFDQSFRLVSATVAYRFGPGTLTSISSYATVRTDYLNDVSVGYVPLLARALNRSYSAVGNPVSVDTDRFVQELRFASVNGGVLEWLVGAYYTHDESSNDQGFELRDLAGQPAVNDLFTFSNPTLFKEYAAFGDLTWHLTQKFDVTGGVRYAENDQVFTQAGSGVLGRSLSRRTSNDSAFTYLGNARYHFTERATGYLRYATGYRPGGPNIFTVNATTGQPNGATTFGADKLESYEAGFKAELVNRALSFDAAAYYIDWSNIQLTTSRGGFATIANVPEGATIRGAELAVTVLPIEDLSLSGAMAYQQAELAGNNTDVGGLKGERLPNVPRFSGVLNADYAFSNEALRPTVGATIRYIGARNASFNASTSAPQYYLPEYTTVDLRAGATFQRVNLQLYVRNLFDEVGQLSEAPAPSALTIARVALIQPRTIGLNAFVDF